jgi:hypothetical protein
MSSLGWRKSHCKNGHERTPDNLSAYGTCKLCQKECNTASWQRRDKESDFQRKRTTSIKRKYGISVEEYDSRLARQGNKCALCGEWFYGKGLGSPAFDHNHVNGDLREFLHKKCNVALGLFEDCLETCEKAVVYLQKHSQGKLLY